MTEDRAATEVLGYVLVIALVTITIGVVMTFGIGGLEASQQSEQVNNMERAFDVLGHNIGQLTGQEAPSRATELRLGDGMVGYGSSTVFNVTSGDENITDPAISTSPLVYSDVSDTTISYESGGIIRTDGDAARFLQEPSIHADDDTLVLTIEQLRRHGGTPESLERSGTVLVRKEHLETTINETSTSEDSVNISIGSVQSDLWKEYLVEQEIGTVTNESETVRLEVSAGEFENVVIVSHHIRMTLSE